MFLLFNIHYQGSNKYGSLLGGWKATFGVTEFDVTFGKASEMCMWFSHNDPIVDLMRYAAFLGER